MRYAVGRVLWIVPLLFVVSLIVFWGLAAGSPRPGSEPVGFDTDPLPLLFNPEPRDVRRLSREAMLSVAQNDTRANEASALLVRLGGAALPHVLPALDTLAPVERARVALALAPVARRMQVGTEEELTNDQAAMVFWRRFWEDRAIDFRPVVAKRSVDRVARKDSPTRRADILQLDTFALPELMRALGSARGERDVVRMARLTDLLRPITGNDWTVHPADSPTQAAEVANQWQRWWTEHAADYVTYDGPKRAYAMVAETEYGRWAVEAATVGFGVTTSGDTVVEVVRRHAPWTLWLVAWGLGGGYFLGLFVGLVSGARAPGPLDTALSVATTALAALPVTWIGSWWLSGPPAWGPFVMVVVVAALTSRYERAAVRAELDAPSTELRAAFGACRSQIARSTWHRSGFVLGSLLGVDLPWLITTAFAVERVLDVPGLSVPTVAAVVHHDVAWLMALALASTTTVALAQLASDSLLTLADPRVRAVLSPRREGWE